MTDKNAKSPLIPLFLRGRQKSKVKDLKIKMKDKNAKSP
jgi:hypothetical protein